MKKIVLISLLILSAFNIQSQNVIIRSGILSVKDVEVFANLTPYTGGAIGFDTRYQGVRGTTRLFDTLLKSLVLVKGEKVYYEFNADIDLVSNSLIITHPNTGKLMEILSDKIEELIVINGDEKLVFRTTAGRPFEKEIKENRFYQILKGDSNQFIRVPVKDFIEADYKRIHSPDRRYDEFKLVNRYYIEGPDKVFHRVQLNSKSLAKLFPDKKDMIVTTFKEGKDADPEKRVIEILEKF